MEYVFYPMMRLILSSWGKQGLLVLCLKAKKRCVWEVGGGGGGRAGKVGKERKERDRLSWKYLLN